MVSKFVLLFACFVLAIQADAGILDLIHRREEASNRVMESTLNPSTSTVNPSEAEYPPLPSHHRKNVSLLENWPEFNMTQLNKSILESKTEFANKLSETLNLLQDIELGNSTLDQTINEMTEYVNNIVDEINESFNMLVTAFKQLKVEAI